MSFEKYQKQAIRTAKIEGFKFNITHAAMGLAGEAGEFTDCIKKYIIYGQSLDRLNAVEELGDILWFVALACETLDVDMQAVADLNIEKLAKRYPEKYTDLNAEMRLDKNKDNYEMACDVLHEEQRPKHTPAPWLIYKRADGLYDIDADENGEEIADVICETVSLQNVNLIAAAPDLLEALINLVDGTPFESDLTDNAKAAIAKATQ